MLSRIFPEAFDNVFRGQWLGLWLFVPIVLLKLVIGANSIISAREVAASADGIPLATFNAAGADAVVGLFVLLGLFQLLLGLLGAVALIRYRAMIPFLYLVLLFQMLGNRALSLLHPIAESGTSGTPPGFYVGLGILVATVAGFVLSLLGGPNSHVLGDQKGPSP
jgi:hypothetical protein